jgi:hypothetical protein
MALASGRLRLQPLLKQGVKLVAGLQTSSRGASFVEREVSSSAVPSLEKISGACGAWGRSLGTAAALAEGEVMLIFVDKLG